MDCDEAGVTSYSPHRRPLLPPTAPGIRTSDPKIEREWREERGMRKGEKDKERVR